jgi:hypothetical protein
VGWLGGDGARRRAEVAGARWLAKEAAAAQFHGRRLQNELKWRMEREKRNHAVSKSCLY